MWSKFKKKIIGPNLKNPKVLMVQKITKFRRNPILLTKFRRNPILLSIFNHEILLIKLI